MVVATALTRLIESGAGLVAATVSADGEPRAERAWAAWPIGGDAARIRFLMGADDPAVEEHLKSGRVSLTGAAIATFRSVQFKGTAQLVEEPNADDMEFARVQIDAFFDAVHRSDGNPFEQLRRMLPHRMIAVEMVVDEAYDQTPGPGAGGVLVEAER